MVERGGWLERPHHRWTDALIAPMQRGNCYLFFHKLKWQRRFVQSDALSVDQIQAVLADLETNEPWHYPLSSLWLSAGMPKSGV